MVKKPPSRSIQSGLWNGFNIVRQVIVRQPLLSLRLIAPLLILVLAYLLRAPILDLVDRFFGLQFMFTVVHVLSTLSVRILFFAGGFAFFTALWFALSPLTNDRIRIIVYAATIAIIVASTLIILRTVKVGLLAGVLTFVLVGINSIASRDWDYFVESKIVGPIIRLGLWLGIGTEAIIPRPFTIWTAQKLNARHHIKPILNGWLIPVPGAAIASGIATLLLPYSIYMQVGEALFMSPEVTIMTGSQYNEWSPHDVSDIARDPATEDLFICGDGLLAPKVLRRGKAPAVSSDIFNGGNEFCEFSASRNLFLTVRRDDAKLLAIDPKKLQINSELTLENLPAGEILMALQDKLGLVAIVSENIYRTNEGADIRIVDLDRLATITEIDDDAGYVIAHSNAPVIYINHFGMDIGIRAYDMVTGKLLATSQVFGRSDRMVFDELRNEVLATAPETGEIRRFDAETLKEKEPIKTVFGARGLAIDPTRDLLLVSSFLTNKLDVIDLETGRRLRTYRLGPWLRDVRVAPDKGIAYVASRYALYEVNYLE